MRRMGLTMAALAAATMLLVAPATAKPPYIKKAKDLGHGDLVKNCASCHVKAMPKAKDAALNPLGEWLVKQKTEKKAAEVDLAWLKDYKPAAK
jgi:hypothetical protein